MMKNLRHSIILRVISENDIQTQGEIAEMLKQEGIVTTQATISRDIKELKLIKVPMGEGKSKYAQNNKQIDFSNISRLRGILKDSIISAESSGNMIVVKTLPGTANAAAAAIDSMGSEEVLGSLAGDDTIFVLMRNERSARDFAARLHENL